MDRFKVDYKVNYNNENIFTTLSAKDAFSKFDEWKVKYPNPRKLTLEIREDGRLVREFQ